MPYLLVILFLLVFNNATAQNLGQKVYRFDAGAEETASDYIGLTSDALYTEEQGYGWTRVPEDNFSRSGRNLFRHQALQQGVQGETIGFRADVPQGKWWLTLWMEAGLEDVNTATLTINGTPVQLAWNAFDQPAEPRTAIQNIYRLLHKPVDAGADGLQFEFNGDADDVRILAFTLHPASPSNQDQASFLSRLRELGSYKTMIYDPKNNEGSVFNTIQAATRELEVLRKELETHEDAHFTSYWSDQMGHLIRAETLLAMRGWDWANDETGMSLFERIHQGIMILDGILDRPDALAFPLYERASFSRGRLSHWLKVEGSSPREIPGIRQPDFVRLNQVHPEDSLFAMYVGKQFDIPDTCDTLQKSTHAPEWAQAQHETLCRLRLISHWWVTEQQAENGELGGKYGDDVEILRWWPALILSGDTITYTGWKRLADGVWNSGKIKEGYAKNVSDVEHASEFVSDTAPVMTLFSDDPVYADRLAYSARHFENLWTGTTLTGDRFFKSAWFSSSEIETDPPKNRDVVYNTRATKAVRYYAWKTGDQHVIDLLSQWSSSWARAAMRTDKDKPRGIVPPSIRFPDGAVNGDEPSWYNANMYWTYFNWRGSAMMLEQMLFTYTQTKDEALLEPLWAALSLIRDYADDEKAASTPGSAAWAVQKLIHSPRFLSVASQWRLVTGDTQFDDVLLRYGTPYLRYRLTNDESHLISGLEEILHKIRFNTPLLTYEAIHTDRIYVTNSGNGSSHLKGMLTGDGMIEDMSPYPVLTWEKAPSSTTALITDSAPNSINASLFVFEAREVDITARVWTLPPGEYTMTLRDESGRKLMAERVTINERGQRLRFAVPGNQLVRLEVEK